MGFSTTYYESPAGAHRLLTEHYGSQEVAVPNQAEVLRLGGHKNSALEEAMRRVNLTQRRHAVDLGCAVGGSVFGLRTYFDRVFGIDRSAPLLAHAWNLQRTGETSSTWAAEGFPPQLCHFRLPACAVTEGVEFIEADLDPLPAGLGQFDLVMTEKVSECLPDPRRFLAQIPGLLAPGGYFLHVSSYRWHTFFTAPEEQLGTPSQVPAQIDQVLGPGMKHESRFNVPFLDESDATGLSFAWRRRCFGGKLRSSGGATGSPPCGARGPSTTR